MGQRDQNEGSSRRQAAGDDRRLAPDANHARGAHRARIQCGLGQRGVGEFIEKRRRVEGRLRQRACFLRRQFAPHVTVDAICHRTPMRFRT